MIQAVITATGVEPVASAGKPEAAMYDEARLLASHDGATLVPKEQCLAIGDRLDTDIEAGNQEVTIPWSCSPALPTPSS